MCDQRRASADLAADGESWRAGLPARFGRDIVVPVRFETFVDAMSGGRRVLGYNVDGTPCYCRVHYVLDSLRSDDDEVYFMAPSLIYRQWSWRLGDGRWLGCVRESAAPGHCRPPLAARYSITPTMPR